MYLTSKMIKKQSLFLLRHSDMHKNFYCVLKVQRFISNIEKKYDIDKNDLNDKIRLKFFEKIIYKDD